MQLKYLVKMYCSKLIVIYLLISFRSASSDLNLTSYHRFNVIEEYIYSLPAKFPDLVEVKIFGKSFEGRNLSFVNLSTNKQVKKPVVLLDAGIHGREWIAPSMALYILHQLTVKYEDNKDLLNKFDWIIIPVLNPDGYEYTFQGDRLWRKTRNTNINSTCVGVDANRNFNFHWMDNVYPVDACAEDYAGLQPFSEPESKALANLMAQHNVQLYLTLHSFGNFILYPYGYTIKAPLRWKELQRIALEAALAIRKHSGTEYVTGSSSTVLYPAPGGSDDYAVGALDVPFAYTIELPKGGEIGFEPAPSEMMQIFEETMLGFEVMVHEVALILENSTKLRN